MPTVSATEQAKRLRQYDHDMTALFRGFQGTVEQGERVTLQSTMGYTYLFEVGEISPDRVELSLVGSSVKMLARVGASGNTHLTEIQTSH